MFFYLLAKHVSIKKNTEQVASITIIKYIFLMLVIKMIEYKYFELGFFNLYVGMFIMADVFFSLYHYYVISSKGINGIHWDDDINDGFSLSKYELDSIIQNNQRKYTTMKFNNTSDNNSEVNLLNINSINEENTDKIKVNNNNNNNDINDNNNINTNNID